MSYLTPIINTETNSSTYYILFGSSTTGILSPRTDSGLIYVPSTNTLTASILKSSIATGTSPFLITSTTLVTNLNVDMVDGKHAADFAPVAHVTADGSSHTFINQSVTTTASPSFVKVTADEFKSGSASIKYNATSKTLDFIFV